MVFRDEEKLKRLNGITHRHIGDEIQRRLREWAMQGGELAALDAIELIGSGLAERCDFTVAVTAPEETRIRRIMARDGISRQQAELRVHAQRPNSYFEENCDHTLTNDSDSEDFICRFNQLMEDILRDGKRERQSVL